MVECKQNEMENKKLMKDKWHAFYTKLTMG